MKIKKVGKYIKEKKQIDILEQMLDELRLECLQRDPTEMAINNNYMKNVMGIYDRWSGEKYYKTFENYLDKIIAPYLKTRNINIGDLK